MKATDALNPVNLQRMVDEKFISVTRHPSCDLYIYNYTAKAAYEKMWNPETLACRGLILDGEMNIVARPFRKFFNMEEHSRSDIIFSKPFDVYDKMDGSLGILYKVPGGGNWAIATRGSFASDQAVRASKILHAKYSDILPRLDLSATYLFEIIYPENRIVVDYHDMEDLVLLAVIDNATGQDVEYPLDESGWVGPIVRMYDGINCKPRELIQTLNPTDDGNIEGFVLRFKNKDSYVRVKVKLEEYKRLHRILTGVSTKTVWEHLRDGKSFSELLERVPDEFNDWLKNTIKVLREQYKIIFDEAKDEFAEVMHKMGISPGGMIFPEDRKEFAEFAKKSKQTALLFNFLDNRDDKIQELIWKQVRPETTHPFKEDEE